MTSHNNFSIKSRQELESMGNLFNSPHLIDKVSYNDMKLKSFELQKDKWREMCSYFRYYP